MTSAGLLIPMPSALDFQNAIEKIKTKITWYFSEPSKSD
jgi:hypothetical protein